MNPKQLSTTERNSYTYILHVLVIVGQRPSHLRSSSHHLASRNHHSLSAPSGRQTRPNCPFNNAEGTRSGCQTSGFLMVHQSLVPMKGLMASRPIRHSTQDYAGDSPKRRTIRVTRYELVSRGAREANNDLKAGLFGSNEPVASLTSKPVTFFCPGVMSASEIRNLKSEKRFP